MDFKERATGIQIGPVSTHGETAIEIYRKDIEDLLAKVPRENLLLIGGDHNSQTGKISERPGTAGKWGLNTPSNEQGQRIPSIGVRRTGSHGSIPSQDTLLEGAGGTSH